MTVTSDPILHADPILAIHSDFEQVLSVHRHYTVGLWADSLSIGIIQSWADPLGVWASILSDFGLIHLRPHSRSLGRADNRGRTLDGLRNNGITFQFGKPNEN